ncbi:MAG: cytochrome c oxidase accessory protein CcoG [Pseudomonadota bacterium]
MSRRIIPIIDKRHLPEVEKQEDGAGEVEVEALYASSKKIYVRAVKGLFSSWRIAFVILTQCIYYGLLWVPWNDRQAVLFDLVSRKFYIFGLVLWPQDVIYLTLLLLISALSLFLFTAVAGRLFCGYACPQTVYTEIFMWIEQKIEGDHVARLRLDSSPWTARKIRLKLTKHFLWLLIAGWTGFTFVGYFTPVSTLISEIKNFSLGGWEAFWLCFYSFATWGNAGFMREQVCKYMCPYARFQSVMFDSDTLIVSYDAARGEPRGSRAKKTDYQAAGLGSCVDCNICVQVCPTGIDIRQGLQYECIGCGACIDACDDVMDKMHYPKGLIRYATERALLTQTKTRESLWQHLFRSRVLIYTALLLVLCGAFAASLFYRATFRADIMRDRGALTREVAGGFIENVYRLNVMNTSEKPLTLSVSVKGMNTLMLPKEQRTLHLAPLSNQQIPVKLRAQAEAASEGSHPIQFTFESVEEGRSVKREEKAIFIMPKL